MERQVYSVASEPQGPTCANAITHSFEYRRLRRYRGQDDTTTHVRLVEWFVITVLFIESLMWIAREISKSYDGPLLIVGLTSSADPTQRRIGNENKENIQEALRTLALYPFTRRLGMPIEEVNTLVARARADAANPSLRAYFPLYVSIRPRTHSKMLMVLGMLALEGSHDN